VCGTILRVFLLLFGTRAAEEESAGGDFETVIHVGAWEYECLKTCMFLLTCGVDDSALPPITPSAHTVHVASLFLATVSTLTAAAQLLGVETWLPEPAALFSGRLFAHLHMGSAAAEGLLQATASVLPAYEISELSAAVLSVFDDTAWLLYGGASDDVDATGVDAGEELGPPLALLGLEATASAPLADPQQGVAAAAQQQPAAGGRPRVPPVKEILPIEEHRETLLASVRQNQVTCIQGETGCGKSSMVPQFLLEDGQARGERVKVMVTQPRRIAAITLARRVADQRGVELGTQVGYRIGQGDHVDSKDSLITFVTVGYMLQYLSHNPTAMMRYTHVVLDEVGLAFVLCRGVVSCGGLVRHLRFACGLVSLVRLVWKVDSCWYTVESNRMFCVVQGAG
jgi:hypothetical protein